MKKQIYILTACFLSILGSLSLSAQPPNTSSQEVIASAGKSDITVGGGYQIDWTIGETLVESLVGSKKRLTQGFHQSNFVKSSYIFSPLDQDKKIHFTVFPNPFVSRIVCQWEFKEQAPLFFEIYDLQGKILYSKKIPAQDFTHEIQLPNLPKSTYVLKVSSPERKFSESHTLVKY